MQQASEHAVVFAMELFKRTNPTTTPKREVEQCTLAKKEDSGCQDKDIEDPEETGRQVSSGT